MKKYVLDANIFIEPFRSYYDFETCPGYWDWLDAANATSSVFSIKSVLKELLDKEDDLSSWAKARPDFFLSDSKEAEIFYPQISSWIASQNYTEEAQRKFFACADYFLVAEAKANQWTIVTHEVENNSINQIKIPEVCKAFGVDHIRLKSLLKAEGVVFRFGS